MDLVTTAATHILLPRQSSTTDTSGASTNIACADDDTTCAFLSLIANPFTSQLYSDAFYASLGTSLGISAGIALLFCFLRPYNNVVYAPRAKYADSKHAPPPVEKGLFGWIPPLIRTKEQDLVDKVGLDAAIFMRFCRMLRNIFVTLTVVGCGVLIPLYLVAANDSAKGVSFFLRLTPQYMYGSQAFWAVVVMAYVFDGVIIGFLWINYKAVLRLRRAWFDSPDYQRSLHARTLLLTDIPPELRSDEGIMQLTDSVKANDATPRAAVARNTKDLPELVEEHEDAVRKLEQYLAKYLKDPNKLPSKRPTCKVSKNDKAYTKGQTVDAIEYLTARIKELEIEIKEVRMSVDKRNAMSYGFASYEDIPDAHGVAYVARKKGPKGTIIRLAPKPNDLVWKNLKMTQKERGWQNFINNLWVAVLTLLWVAPNVMIAVFLSNLSHLGVVWPAFRESLAAHRVLWAFVQGVLSPAITTAFYYYLPAVFRRLCVNAGDVTKTSRERHVMHKLYSFFVFNNLVVFSLFSAIFGYVSAVVKGSQGGGDVWKQFENSHPFQLVVSTLCQVSPYWISWLLQRNLGAAVDLSQLASLIWGSIKKRFMAPTPRELIELTAPQPFDYAGYYNYFLFYATVAMCFATLQPLVLPVTALYFWLDSFLKKYLLLYIFITKYESGGMFWRSLFNRVLIAALLGNVVVALLVTAQGVAGANWGMLAALGPLPLIILAFKIYCMRTYDDAIHYYQKGVARRDVEGLNGAVEGKKRKGDRVGVRFGHPVLYKPLMTPMVAAKSQHLLKTIYSGRTSMDDGATVGGYSDVYMDSMSAAQPGKTTGGTPGGFEIVNENEMDFEHWKHRPEFRDEHGGDGEVFGRAQDMIRPGTPGSMTTMARTNTWETDADRSRSQSRDAFNDRGRSESRGSEATRVPGETEYPRGYHSTPSNLRGESPAGSDWSGRGRVPVGGMHKESHEGLVASAARMGKSPPPGPMPGSYGEMQTPGSTPGEQVTSYDYFKQNRRDL
ncbi:hypothetical protein LTR56_022820 [Elasticomyces elasticus]|nr:hypothetical protein LTR56_022820 [Elasticomyces elasticus]KAK3627525.1 hypothetical protein LTR22_022713 [Elasticomyces elasticus]KAK4907654.1 hypothetical protein LTR49_023354 [Elasticomyces elasticus]KAK5747825.1 hypothetical protein LTS12_022131 [Elasticomyces elasticus]